MLKRYIQKLIEEYFLKNVGEVKNFPPKYPGDRPFCLGAVPYPIQTQLNDIEFETRKLVARCEALEEHFGVSSSFNPETTTTKRMAYSITKNPSVRRIK